MATTHIPVMDLHADKTVTLVTTCETCYYFVRRSGGTSIPPRVKAICRLSGVHVSGANIFCHKYHRGEAA